MKFAKNLCTMFILKLNSQADRFFIMTEVKLDALYVSADYIEGYGEGAKNEWRPKTREAVIAAWRGLACESDEGGQIVGVVPRVLIGESVVNAPCEETTKVSVRAESERDIR